MTSKNQSVMSLFPSRLRSPQNPISILYAEHKPKDRM